MLLTITTTHSPATDLGYLLHKHPDRIQEFSLPFGKAIVFYPEATEERCTAVLLLEIDPVGLVRKKSRAGKSAFPLRQYVNDRPYAATSFMSVALASVFGTAMNGRCPSRQELAETPIPLEAHVPSLPCKGDSDVLQKLFGPLGYTMQVTTIPLDPAFPEWGDSAYCSVTLSGTVRLSDLLSHLYVLMPVLDNDKHYWVGEDEVEKLLRRGEGWLADHPEREFIARRYLRHKRSLANSLLEQLESDLPELEEAERAGDANEEQAERKIGLHEHRLERVRDLLAELGSRSVLDLGCGEGKLLRLLAKDRRFERITGMDISSRSLGIAGERLGRLAELQRKRVNLLLGSLTYRDRRLEGFDAAAVVEVIEHLESADLASLERVLFEFARPRTVIVTTPNSEYNVMWPSLPAGRFRHHDHRFEWTRAEFREWAERVAAANGYEVVIQPLGPEEEGIGAPSQLGVFTQCT